MSVYSNVVSQVCVGWLIHNFVIDCEELHSIMTKRNSQHPNYLKLLLNGMIGWVLRRDRNNKVRGRAKNLIGKDLETSQF